MGNDDTPQFGIISIDAFLENSTLVKYVYDQITLSEWQVNSLSASYHLSVGLKGISVNSYDDVSDNREFAFFVNGSSYFQGNCKINNNLIVSGNTIFDNDLTVKNMRIMNNLSVMSDSYFNNVSVSGIVDITSNLIVRDDVLLYSKLNVSDNTTLSNLYVNNNAIFNSNVSIIGITDISNSLIVKGPVSFNSSLSVIGKSFFNDIVNYSNISPTLYISNIAITNNLSVLQNASINKLYANNASLNTLYVNNNASFNDGFYIKETAVINNMSVQNNTILNTLDVKGNTTLSTTTVNSLLNVNQVIVNNNSTVNTLNINGLAFAENNVEFRKVVYIGPAGQTPRIDSTLHVNNIGFIDTLYANKIRCNDMTADTLSQEQSNVGNTLFTMYNRVNTVTGNMIYTKYVFGLSDSTILTNTYTYGIFSHGLTTFDPSYTYGSYFDINANAASSGITYNGPMNIGLVTPNTFNLTGNGIMNYDGIMNIGQTTSTEFNLSGFGVINYDGNINIGNIEESTQLNINGYGVIMYDGSMNIGQNVLSEFNLNASGIMKYDGIINIGSNAETYLDICANSLTTGIIYNGPVNITSNELTIDGTGMINYNGFINMNGPIYIEHDGDITLDVIGNTKIHGNLLLGGNITSYSDIKIKDNICKLTSCLTKIENITGYSFTRKDLVDKDKIYIGLIAQEVEQTFPDLVTETNDIKSINYQSMIAVLLECIKELKEDIKELKEKFMN